jgi:hypothetical protein
MNRKKLYRIYREEKLMVHRRGRRKRAIGSRAPLALPDAINPRWSLDLVLDALSDGRRFRIFCVVDDFSRECLATVVDTSIGGVRVSARTGTFGDGTRRPKSDRQRQRTKTGVKGCIRAKFSCGLRSKRFITAVSGE